jgi:signal transduction histidine kinase
MTDFSSPRPVRILCLEDNDHDRELIEEILTADGLPCQLIHAKNRAQFETALARNPFDLIISDFTLPSYGGLAALAAAQKSQEQTPFIFVSGTIGEEQAIESLKNGATDYVLKDRRDRLVPAIRRALREGRERFERKLLEDQLRQSQKMEAVGQLAGGVAHDFNNLLAVIHVNAELALMNADKLDPQTRDNLSQIVRASERAANLTRQLLAFGRKQAMRPEPVNLVDVINDLARMLERIIGEDVVMECAHARRLPFVLADVSMLEQVLLNLVVNARDAMPHGGQLLISTKKIRVYPGQLRSNPESRVGEFVCIRVRDSGCGIAPEHLPRIFEPFFTTKEIGKGTGLGPATVYGIVKQQQGWIRVSSQVGRGTVFRVFLPATDPPSATPAFREAEPATRTGGEKILLVEDDAAVRLAVSQILGASGYQVIEAASGPEALKIWQTLGTTIDLLLTDMVMPDGITGRQLAEQLRRQRPLLKVVFVSGYSVDAFGGDSDFLSRENNFFLQKPYPSKALLDLVRRCLDAVPRSR